jgi:hypothetical protein
VEKIFGLGKTDTAAPRVTIIVAVSSDFRGALQNVFKLPVCAKTSIP